MKEVNYNKLCGEKIKEARIAKNLTEQELAYSIDPDNFKEVTRLIKYWEVGNGFPDLNQIYKIAEILDMNPNELYYYSENGKRKINRNKGPMTVKQYDRKRYKELMMEDLENFGPAIVYALLFALIVVGPVRVIGILSEIFNFFFGWLF